MKRPLQFAAALLTVTFAVTTLFAQSQQGQKNSDSSRSTGATAGRNGFQGGGTTGRGSSGGSGNISHGHHNPTPTNSFVHADPFHPEIHLPGSRLGCRGCGYSTYGGYVYGGYESNYYNPVGPTTTDRVLANGGTFNNINNADDYQPPPQQQAPIYVRPEYPTQYATDNSTVNTPIQNNVASASSDSPAILIFRDGTNLTIHNYAIYGANIIVLTPERKKFPIAALDISATQKANEAAGYELKVPAVFTTH